MPLISSEPMQELKEKLDPKDCPCIYSCCKEGRACCGQGYCDILKAEDQEDE